MPNAVREARYRPLLYIGHHTILGQMETVQLHTRIALLESMSWTVLGYFRFGAQHRACRTRRYAARDTSKGV